MDQKRDRLVRSRNTFRSAINVEPDHLAASAAPDRRRKKGARESAPKMRMGDSARPRERRS